MKLELLLRMRKMDLSKGWWIPIQYHCDEQLFKWFLELSLLRLSNFVVIKLINKNGCYDTMEEIKGIRRGIS